MDYGYRSPQGQIWSCDSLQTAQEIVIEAPHMEIVARDPHGEWETVPVVDAVTQYDIATNPQAATSYRTMDVREADAHVRCALELGDTIQDYDTTDRAGNPLRVVLHICADIPEDQGGVYEFALPAPALPSTERRPVPDSSSNGYAAHHDAVYADPRVTSIDTSADYVGEHSHDNGQTWQLRLTSGPWDHVSGHVVLGDVAGALLAGYDAVADGSTRILRSEGGRLTRWTLRDCFPYPAA